MFLDSGKTVMLFCAETGIGGSRYYHCQKELRQEATYKKVELIERIRGE